MEAQAIAQADYLDILFDKRNKRYGSYELRKHHDRRMMQALLMIVGSCITLLVWSMIPGNKPDRNILPPVFEREVELVHPDKILPPKPVEPLPPEPPAVKPTVANPVPVIRPDEIVTEAPVTVDSFDGRESGAVTATGSPDGEVVATTSTTGTGSAPAPVAPPVALDFSEVMPAFKGDVYAYLAKSVKYPRAAVQNGIEGRVVTRFVVYEDGTIHDVKVVRGIGGGCDEEAIRVIKTMPAWEPGMQNGRKVRVNFVLPINFRLD